MGKLNQLLIAYLVFILFLPSCHGKSLQMFIKRYFASYLSQNATMQNYYVRNTSLLYYHGVRLSRNQPVLKWLRKYLTPVPQHVIYSRPVPQNHIQRPPIKFFSAVRSNLPRDVLRGCLNLKLGSGEPPDFQKKKTRHDICQIFYTSLFSNI